MSGLRKAKKYDWKDSNLALFGSDTEKEVKKASAETEPAWNGAGSKVGLQVWRIEKFKVKHWPKEEYGHFYDGDSYIILNTYKPDPDSEKLAWDVHFWIGKYSSQDEYGTAAYKTVELDTFLDDGPVQHREVMGHESSLFKGYFNTLVYMKGGCDSGFRHVEPAKYQPRLMLVKKVGRKIEIKEIPMRRKNINSGDVFIMDLGLKIYQFNGAHCSKDEKYNATTTCRQWAGERSKAKHEVLEENATPETHEFYEKLVIDVGDVEFDDDDDDAVDGGDRKKKLFRLSDASGSLNFDYVAEGNLSRDMLDTNDSFIVDTGSEVIVWVGNNASSSEKKYGMQYAHTYCMNSDNPLAAVTVLREDQKAESLELALAA